MHLSIAAHFCGGEISEWKISSSEAKAGCGMCHEEAPSSSPVLHAPDCCSDALSVLKVDHDFQPTSVQVRAKILFAVDLFHIHDFLQQRSAVSTVAFHALVRPPGNLPEAVNLSDICVFRI